MVPTFLRGTTLGGDDGVAVAYALALLDSKEIPHPPLEVIITVDEEIGMLGAAAMDLSDLRGRTMVNLDSEDEGILTVSCAGGATAFIDLPLNRRPVYGPCVEILVDGLQGATPVWRSTKTGPMPIRLWASCWSGFRRKCRCAS